MGSRCISSNASPGRITLSLDGEWQVDESISATAAPTQFKHRAPVPGLADLARPPFKDIDLFDSQELIASRIRHKWLPESARVNTAGNSRQERNYFWYRKVFKAPTPRAAAFLKINKAQFGTAVWLNGQKLGEYAGCFTASFFPLSGAVRWGGDNELVIRIGAHPGVLPVSYPAGADFEKLKWTPGIYDSVSAYFCDNPVIETIQVAPRIENSEIIVQTRLKNFGLSCSTTLDQKVKPWKGSTTAAAAAPVIVQLQAGEERVVTQTIPIPQARLWSPEDPFLYVLESRTGGDSVVTRFGMREFRSDARTKRFYLNGKVYYLRGSNITFHRFLEDPDCGNLPWNQAWVRKLLGEIPKQMHWNSFRFCIGPVPDQWLDIADEAGLLIQNEFFIWTASPRWETNCVRHWDVPEMTRQFSDWMRDNWNHPSVAIWDANNESEDPIFHQHVIPAVRGLDLSHRPWENSYNPPAGQDDPVEYHPYLFMETATRDEIKFRLTDLERMDGHPSAWFLPKVPHPILVNEYGWLWLNRDGSPTVLTDKLYPLLLGTNTTASERFAFQGYVLAAETEFWRAHRQFAGVLHFVYLTSSYPGVYTSDHFLNLENLKLEPHFVDYMSEAFKPLGVYINFFQPTLFSSTERSFTIMLVNDEARPVEGQLVLALETIGGRELGRVSRRFTIAALGDAAYELPLRIPSATGQCVLKAVAKPQGKGCAAPTISRRWVSLEQTTN
jgi:hypothetical protein